MEVLPHAQLGPAQASGDKSGTGRHSDPSTRSPRLGFLGVGWIGRQRMEAIVADECALVAAVSDLSPSLAEEAREMVPDALLVASLDELLALDLDGIVIATPSALHAAQAEAALDAGMAVFCQKPLARDAGETARVIAAARTADRLLGVDLSYRHTHAMRVVRGLVQSGDIGQVYAIDLVFHNAYGPDKPWFRNAALSGGGCVIDLGIHLVDLALWTLDFPEVRSVTSRLYAQGRLLDPKPTQVEDYAVAMLDLAAVKSDEGSESCEGGLRREAKNDEEVSGRPHITGGAVARLACSWNLAAGMDAVIELTFHGTRGGAQMRNVGGSFYDFVAERFDGTSRSTLAAPPDAWGGRAAVAWARQLAANPHFDPQIEQLNKVAGTLDAIYGKRDANSHRWPNANGAC